MSEDTAINIARIGTVIVNISMVTFNDLFYEYEYDEEDESGKCDSTRTGDLCNE